jgi:hypothetical protein
MRQAISDFRIVVCVLLMTALPCGCGNDGSVADANRSDSELLQQPPGEDRSLAGLPLDAPVLFMTHWGSRRESYLEVAIWQDGSVLLGAAPKGPGRATMWLGSMESVAVDRLLSRLDKAGFFRRSPEVYHCPDAEAITIGARFRGRRNAHCWDEVAGQWFPTLEPSLGFRSLWGEVTKTIRGSCPTAAKEAPASFRCYDSRVPIEQTHWLQSTSWAPLEAEKQSR